MKQSAIFESFGHPVIAVDGEDRIVEWNRAAERVFEIPCSKARGRRAQDLMKAHDVFGNPICPRGCGVHELARRGEVANSCEWELRGLRSGSQRFHVVFETIRQTPSRYTLVYHLRPERRAQISRRRTDALGPAPQFRESAQPHTGPAQLADLTPREVEVLRLVEQGAGTPQIARKLGISRITVRNHVERMLKKLGVHSRLEAASLAHRAGFQ